MRAIISLLILSCSILLLSKSVSATRYYVDSLRGKDSNSGTSPSKPWKTIAGVNRKMSLLVAGDIVSFKRDRTWTGKLTINRSGIFGNPITFNAYGKGKKPIIRYPRTDSPRIILVTGNYVVISGLKIKDGYYRGIDIKSNYTVVKNCEFTNVGTGVDVQGDHNLITKTHFHDLIMVVNDQAPNNDFGVVGVCLKNTDNEVSYNKMINLREPCIDYKWAGRCVEIFGQASRSYIHHNWSYRNQGFLEAGAAVPTVISDVRIEYNVTLDAGRFTGINNSPGDYECTPVNWLVQNNTIVDTKNSPVTMRDSALVFDAIGQPGQFIFRNNILYFEKWNRIANEWTTFDHDHNLFYFYPYDSGTYNITMDGTDIKGINPRFVALSEKNLHLRASSPARDKGLDLGYSATVDFDGNPVPYGPAPDIGAYEYVSSTAALGGTTPDGTSKLCIKLHLAIAFRQTSSPDLR